MVVALSASVQVAFAAGPVTPPLNPKVQEINDLARPANPVDAAPLLPYFADPDPTVRQAAANAIGMTRVNTADEYRPVVALLEDDPSPDVRAAASNSLRALSLNAWPKNPGLARPVAEQLLADVATHPPTARRTADLRALGHLQGDGGGGLKDEQIAAAVRAYTDAMADTDGAVRLAGVDATADLLNGGDWPSIHAAGPARAALLEHLATDTDPLVRSRAGLTVYRLLGGSLGQPVPDDIVTAVARLKTAAATPDDRAMSQLLSRQTAQVTYFAAGGPRIGPPPAAPADWMPIPMLRCHYRWVRAATSMGPWYDRPAGTPAEQAAANDAALRAVVLDPDPVVAADAAMALAGLSRPIGNMAWVWYKLTFATGPAGEMPRPSWGTQPPPDRWANDVALCHAPLPADRCRGAAALGKHGVPLTVPILIGLFGDPDAEVRRTARSAALASVPLPGAQQFPFPRGVRAATQPTTRAKRDNPRVRIPMVTGG